MDPDLRLPARGLELAADAYGPDDGPPVLLFPGGGQTRHSWGATARLLGDKGWRATTVDLRGHGDSDWAPDGDYSLDAFAGDVRTVARATRRAHGRTPALVGASLGGVASLVAIAEAEDADADPEAEPGGEAPGPERPGAGGAESGKCSVEARAARSEAARAEGITSTAGHAALLDGFMAHADIATAGEARSVLAKFGLRADHVLRPPESLSPGERTRAMLAALQARGVNLLVLDEPTNQLDLPAIEQLEQALQGYKGTLILVTHDRRLLDAVGMDRVVDVVAGSVAERR